jgi:hypothetical protein
MKANFVSAAATLCVVSGLAMAQDGSCCEKAGKVVECEASVESAQTTTDLLLASNVDNQVVVDFAQPETRVEHRMVMIQKDDDHEYKIEVNGDDVQAWVDGDRVSKKRLKVTDKTIRILDADGETVVKFDRQVQRHLDTDGEHEVELHMLEGDGEHRIKLHRLEEGGEHQIQLHRLEGEGEHRIQMHGIEGDAGNVIKLRGPAGEGDHEIMYRKLLGDGDAPIVWEGDDGDLFKVIEGFGGKGDLRFFGEGEEGIHFMQPEGDHPPVMIGITMGSLDGADVDDEVFDILDDRDIDADDAFVVLSVIDNLPADKAGLRAGDVVVRIDDRWGVGSDRLLDVLMDKEPGDGLEVLVIRDGRRHEVEIELAPWSGEKLGKSMNFEVEGRFPGTLLRNDFTGDVEVLLEQLHENTDLNEDLEKQIKVLVQSLRQGEQGRVQLDTLPRIRGEWRSGVGEQPRMFVQPPPAPRAESVRNYEGRLAQIEERLERMESRMDRILRALERRERDGD